jgi:hypothetical protein
MSGDGGTYAPASEESVAYASDLIRRIHHAPTKASMRDLRIELGALAKDCRSSGTTLDLSDPDSVLGAQMREANAESKRKGWV